MSEHASATFPPTLTAVIEARLSEMRFRGLMAEAFVDDLRIAMRDVALRALELGKANTRTDVSALPQAVEELRQRIASMLPLFSGGTLSESEVESELSTLAARALELGRAQAPAPERRHYRQAFSPMTACGLRQRGCCVMEWASVDCPDCLLSAPPATGDRPEVDGEISEATFRNPSPRPATGDPREAKR